MAAGYELTQVRPGQADYMAVDTRVKPVLEYIFAEGFPNDITEVKHKNFVFIIMIFLCALHEYVYIGGYKIKCWYI